MREVIEHRTKEDHVTGQGFGYSRPIENPKTVKTVYYVWSGKLHNTAANVVRAHAIRESLSDLAESFSVNYMSHLNETAEKKGEPSYSLVFSPPEGEDKKVASAHYAEGVTVRVRSLTPKEVDEFESAFQATNKAISGNVYDQKGSAEDSEFEPYK